MNAEQLHDALNQLPDELIAETDALRQQKKQRPLIWKRLVPIAACFALVLGALYVAMPLLGMKSDSQESMIQQEAASSIKDIADTPEFGSPGAVAGGGESPAEAEPEEDDRELKNDGAPLAPETEDEAQSTAAAPIPVTSHAYRTGAEEPDRIQITVIHTESQWAAYLSENARLAEEHGFENGYDEAYFEKNQLIVVLTTAASSSVEYRVEAIQKTGIGSWELTGVMFIPAWFTEDMTQQHVLIELPRMVEPEDTVTWNLETERGNLETEGE